MFILKAKGNKEITKEYKTKQGALNYAKKHIEEFDTIEVIDNDNTLIFRAFLGKVVKDISNRYQLTLWYDDETDVDYLDVEVKTKKDIKAAIIEAIGKGFDVLSVEVYDRRTGKENHIKPHIVEEYKAEVENNQPVIEVEGCDLEKELPELNNSIVINYKENTIDKKLVKLNISKVEVLRDILNAVKVLDVVSIEVKNLKIKLNDVFISHLKCVHGIIKNNFILIRRLAKEKGITPAEAEAIHKENIQKIKKSLFDGGNTI